MKIILLLTSLLLFSLTTTTANAQTNDTINIYLDKLAKNAKTEKGYVSDKTYDLMKKLFKTVIRQNYADTLNMDEIPGDFYLFNQNNQVTYYQSSHLSNERVLFIWATKVNKQWNLFSHLESDIWIPGPYSYRCEKGFNFFSSGDYCIYGKTGDITWQRIDLDPANKNYCKIFRCCESINDSMKFCGESGGGDLVFPELKEEESAMLSSPHLHDKQYMDSAFMAYAGRADTLLKKQGQGIYLSVSYVIFNDLDNDGQEEIYWFSVSDKKLEDFKVYHLAETGLVEIDSKNFIDKLKQTKEFTDLCKITTLIISPPFKKK